MRIGVPVAALNAVLLPAPQVGAVVVGLDRYINYYKLQYATTCLINDSSCM